MGLGHKVITELSTGNSYYDILNRNIEEIDKIEEELRTGVLPSVFRLHSKESLIAPKSAEEYLDLLLLVDINQAQTKIAKEIVERVMGYPSSYYDVKRKITEKLRERSLEYIKKNKKLECSLFKAHIQILSRCTKAYFAGMIKPLVEGGMNSTLSLILSRVIMKSTPERAYMDELLLSMLRLERTHAVYTLLTSILIKNVQFKQETVDKIYEYVLEGPSAQEQRYLAWNKVVLIFLRNYKKQIDLAALKEIYAHAESPIEVEIGKELSTE